MGAHCSEIAINRLYLKIDRGDRSLIALEECVQKERKHLQKYFDINTGTLLKTVDKERVIKCEMEGKGNKREHLYRDGLGKSLWMYVEQNSALD